MLAVAKKKFEVVYTMSHRFKKAVDYRIYLLVDTSTKNDRSDSKYIAKMAKRIAAQVKPHDFDPFDPIFIIAFLKYLNLTCDFNGVH